MNSRVALIIILVAIFACCIPASAEITLKSNSTADGVSQSGYFHDTGYVPETYVWIAIVLGFVSLEISTFIKKEVNIFLLITPVLWLYAAWYAAFMEREIVTAIPGSTGDVQLVYTEIVFASPMLQLAMVLFFLLSLLYAIYVLFIQEPEFKPAPTRMVSDE